MNPSVLAVITSLMAVAGGLAGCEGPANHDPYVGVVLRDSQIVLAQVRQTDECLPGPLLSLEEGYYDYDDQTYVNCRNGDPPAEATCVANGRLVVNGVPVSTLEVNREAMVGWDVASTQDGVSLEFDGCAGPLAVPAPDAFAFAEAMAFFEITETGAVVTYSPAGEGDVACAQMSNDGLLQVCGPDNGQIVVDIDPRIVRTVVLLRGHKDQDVEVGTHSVGLWATDSAVAAPSTP